MKKQMDKAVVLEENGETDSIRIDILGAYNINEMRDFLVKYSPYYTDWKKFMSSLFNDYAYNILTLADACGFSRNTVRKWRDNGDIPRNRREFIQLGYGIGMSLDGINKLLQRYGKYPKLYAKSIEDAIYIYVITNKLPFSKVKTIYQKLSLNIKTLSCEYKAESISDIENTFGFQEQIKALEVLNEDAELLNFIDSHEDVFQTGYNKLIIYIENFIAKKIIDYTEATKKGSFNSLLNERISNPRIIAVFNNMVSSLRTRKIIPNRTRLVALGIHLEMTIDEIDEMLELAGMERLCAKDKVECVLIFALENLLYNDCDYDLLKENLLVSLESDASTRDKYYQILRKYNYADESNDFTSELAAYLKDTIYAMDINEARELLELLY